jgi:hypothetical protein
MPRYLFHVRRRARHNGCPLKVTQLISRTLRHPVDGHHSDGASNPFELSCITISRVLPSVTIK